MTAPEREALVKALRSKAETYDLYDPWDVSATLRKAADMIEALSAPAVTVTEEMVEKAAAILDQRAIGYEDRATSIFNGKIVAEELRWNSTLIRALKSTTPQTGSQE